MAHGPEGDASRAAVEPPHEKASSDGDDQGSTDAENQISTKVTSDDEAIAQIIGVGILEFGVVLHRSAS